MTVFTLLLQSFYYFFHMYIYKIFSSISINMLINSRILVLSCYGYTYFFLLFSPCLFKEIKKFVIFFYLMYSPWFISILIWVLPLGIFWGWSVLWGNSLRTYLPPNIFLFWLHSWMTGWLDIKILGLKFFSL